MSRTSRTSMHSTRTRRSRTSDGFTFFELVAVMVIVAVLAVTAAPAFHSLGQTRNAAAARHLLRDLSFARSLAQATGTRTWVVFDLAAQNWVVMSEDPDDPGRRGATAMIDAGTGREMIRRLGEGDFASVVLDGVSVPGGGTEIGFDWLGRPLRSDEEHMMVSASIVLSGGHTIVLEGRTGYAMQQ